MAASRWLPDLGVLPDLVAAHVLRRYTPERRRREGRTVDVAWLADLHREALAELSACFTSDRDALPPGYLSQPRYRAAYLLYFVATGAATVLSVLHGARALPALPAGATLRVLDLGAGPLTASLAVALALPADVHLEVVAVDGSAAILEDGRTLLQALRPEATVTLVAANLREGRGLAKGVQGRFDLVLAANVLNEWAVGGRKRQSPGDFVARVLDAHLADGGAAVLVEPGTRTGSHALIEVREDLLPAGDFAVLSPCMSATPCPLAEGALRDWCHAEQPWQRPALVAGLDDAIGHRRATLKSSHLVLARRPQPEPTRDRYRVLGGPMRAQGAFRRYLCGPDGKVVATVPEAGLATWPALRDAWRGDALVLPGQLTLARRGPVQEPTLLPRKPA